IMLRAGRPPQLSILTVAGLLLLLSGCAPTVNLLNPLTPKFEGSYARPVSGPAPAASSRIRVVSFNIKLGDEIDRAIEVLRGGELGGADVISLQEVDEVGTERIA